MRRCSEKVQYVEKDTIVNSKIYHLIKGYNTTMVSYGFSGAYNAAAHTYNCYRPKIILIREDTLTKKIYTLWGSGEKTLLDFNLNLGDSLNYIPPDTSSYSKFPVDSIGFNPYMGILRRIQFGNYGQAPSSTNSYFTIEGIGATLNFPDARTGEWGIPVFTLRAFIKNKNVLYKDSQFPIDSCYRKPRVSSCWPSSTFNVETGTFHSNFNQNTLNITNPMNKKLRITILNLQGQPIFNLQSKQQQIQHRIENVGTGIYILSVQSIKGMRTKKIFIQ